MAKRVLRSSIRDDVGVVLQGELTENEWNKFWNTHNKKDYNTLYIDKGAVLSCKVKLDGLNVVVHPKADVSTQDIIEKLNIRKWRVGRRWGV